MSFRLKTILVVLAILLGVAVNYRVQGNLGTTEEPKEAIGYYEQYLQMKTDENGEIPRGLHAKWRNDRELMKKASNLFKSLEEVGPNNVGGRTRFIKQDLQVPNKLWAGGVSGGLWTSPDGGASWEAVDDYNSSLAVTCFSQNPLRPNEIVYGTGEARGNSTGQAISGGIAGEGVFQSYDGGKTFRQVEETLDTKYDDIWDIQYSKIDSHSYYIATNTSGIYRTSDSGKTFDRVMSTGTPITRIQILDDGTVYFCMFGSGIYKAHENDFTPVRLSGLPTSNIGRCNLSYCESQDNVLYAYFSARDGESILGVYRSNDGGENWSELANPDNTTNLNFTQGAYNSLLGVSPNDPNHVILGAVRSVFSVNGGSSWVALPNSHSDYHYVEFFPNSKNCLIGNDGGVHKYNFNSSSRTYSSTSLNNSYNVTQFYCGTFYPEGDDIVGGTQDNGTWSGLSDNTTFYKVYGGDGSFCEIDNGGERLYYSWQNGRLRRRTLSTNSNRDLYNALAGATGTTDFWFINPFTINHNASEQIYFPTKRYIARSTDAGISFELITDRIIGSAYAIACTDEEDPTIYFGGQSGVFYRIDNAKTAQSGSEYRLSQQVPNGVRTGFIGNIEIDPQKDSTVYLAMTNVSSNSHVWKVHHADTEFPIFEDIGSNLPEFLPVNWIEVDPLNTDHIIAATDFGLYTTVNGGGWWEKVPNFPNVPVHMLKLRDHDRTLFIYTHGRGSWVAKLSDEVTSIKKEVSKAMSIFPNPAQDLVNLSIDKGIYKLFSLNGQVVQTGEVIDGIINVTNLYSGNYFLKAESNGTIYTSRLVKK